MKLIGDGGAGGGRKVLVGVKLDPRSRELLTWALVKVAQPGDLVIALHVLDTITGISLPPSLLPFLACVHYFALAEKSEFLLQKELRRCFLS